MWDRSLMRVVKNLTRKGKVWEVLYIWKLFFFHKKSLAINWNHLGRFFYISLGSHWDLSFPEFVLRLLKATKFQFCYEILGKTAWFSVLQMQWELLLILCDRKTKKEMKNVRTFRNHQFYQNSKYLWLKTIKLNKKSFWKDATCVYWDYGTNCQNWNTNLQSSKVNWFFPTKSFPFLDNHNFSTNKNLINDM